MVSTDGQIKKEGLNNDIVRIINKTSLNNLNMKNKTYLNLFEYNSIIKYLYKRHKINKNDLNYFNKHKKPNTKTKEILIMFLKSNSKIGTSKNNLTGLNRIANRSPQIPITINNNQTYYIKINKKTALKKLGFSLYNKTINISDDYITLKINKNKPSVTTEKIQISYNEVYHSLLKGYSDIEFNKINLFNLIVVYGVPLNDISGYYKRIKTDISLIKHNKALLMEYLKCIITTDLKVKKECDILI